jgi:alkanesulfonate monooxygenase SsuD/methylene tetrahydromethanopterin reductase-like flavin-dependent oxidoreductase (luciferase family)
MWTQSPATYEGRHYQVHEAYCVPQPARPIPILVGGRRPKLMRVVAEKADIWQWDGPIERYRPPYELLVANCAEMGRELSSVRLSTSGEVYLPDDPAGFPSEPASSFLDAAQDPSGAYAGEMDWVLGPTPDDVVRGLEPLLELGVSHLTMYFWDVRSLQRFADEVVPRLR